MPNQPIPVAEAQEMIKTYTAYMQKLGVDMQKQTQSVSFKLPELMAWLTKMTELADEIRICMGDYPAGHPEAGRTTVILWPYKNGQPAQYSTKPNPGDGGTECDDDDDDCEEVDPYNQGQLYP
ncbi:MAG TPA: hypothetical protein VHN59_18420 [Chitinophagaceae bacterium]|nr:hypothetical protein [Chitinophagaceae bacterium]